METRSCTCLKFQENQIPCSHAWACICALGKAPNAYFPSILSIETWKQTYSKNWNPVNIENLSFESQSCYPPVTRRLPGRPKIRRAVKGDRGLAALTYARRANGENIPERIQHCSNCGQSTHHNRRTCTTKHS